MCIYLWHYNVWHLDEFSQKYVAPKKFYNSESTTNGADSKSKQLNKSWQDINSDLSEIFKKTTHSYHRQDLLFSLETKFIVLKYSPPFAEYLMRLT